ncbi:fatty acid--CoA ligase [Hydrogenophaga sp.]|uniref:fatty acid--CoA ligase n=1 Tax=Hydrogenophaga sp. TaxID=1904254 RepID=UPI002FCAD262
MKNTDDRVIEHTPSAYSYPLLIKQLLHTPLANAPEQEIVYRDLSRYTYRGFAQRVAQQAHMLRSLGVAAGDVVAIMDWDSHRYLESYFAVPMMGTALMMVNIRLSNDQIAYALDHSGATTLLVHADFLPVLEAIHPRLPQLKRIVLLQDALPAETPLAVAGEYEAMMAAQPGTFPFRDFDENTLATTFYTTGTTGLPKAVYFSHRQIVLHTLAGASGLAASPQHQRFHRGDVYMPLTPMFHVHAWGLPFVATLLGVKQVYPGRYRPEHIVELVLREGVTFSHGVPTVLQMVLAAAKGSRFEGWKIVSGGSVMPPHLCQEALAQGIDIFTGYGMSETCPLLTLAQRPARQDVTASQDFRMAAGWSIPLVDLRVVDESLRELPHDGKAVGEVVVRAPWLTQGYRGNAEASEALWRGGYLHTQDMGRIDATGCLRLVDRIKDVIKTGGEWVSSLDLEQLLAAHPGVAEVAVVAAPCERWGERPIAVVVRRPDNHSATEKALRDVVLEQAAKGLLPKYAVPDRIHFVDAIDKTSVGKFDKKALRQKFAHKPASSLA